MVFWRVLDNKVYDVFQTDKLGFEKSEPSFIPDDYLDAERFVIMRTAHGLGDWGIISAMPRLLKKKYPNCKVYIPSENLLKTLFGNLQNNWQRWDTPFKNAKRVFRNNPYVDGFVDTVSGDVFHDHYRIYDNDNIDTPLLEQMLNFWQFDEDARHDSQPELYWTDGEIELGDKIIEEFVGQREFGCLLISDRFGTQCGKYDEQSYQNDKQKIEKLLNDNKLPYFYWTYKSLDEVGFNFIDSVLDMHNMDIRLQLYIKSKAKINIGNQCGTNHCVVRYSDVYEVQRQTILGINFVKGEVYI
jgi:hypothetical protein